MKDFTSTSRLLQLFAFSRLLLFLVVANALKSKGKGLSAFKKKRTELFISFLASLVLFFDGSPSRFPDSAPKLTKTTKIEKRERQRRHLTLGG